MKKIVIEALIVSYYKKSLWTTVRTDGFDHVNSSVFLYYIKMHYYIVLLVFKNLNFAEWSYDVYNKKKQTMIRYLEK